MLSLGWKCSDEREVPLLEGAHDINHDSFSPFPPFTYLYLIFLPFPQSSSISLINSQPFFVTSSHTHLTLIYENEIPQEIPSNISITAKKCIYLQITSLPATTIDPSTSDPIKHWSSLNKKLQLLKPFFHLISFRGELLLLIQEKDLNLVEFFLTRSDPQEVSFVFPHPRLLIQSSIESRNYTILNSLIRFHSHTFPSAVVIHCLGAETNECEDLSMIPEMYSPLLRVLEAFGVRDCSLHFIGPNLLGREHDRLQILPSDESALHLKLVKYCGLYHDYWRHQQHSSDETVDLLICFNAGFWGYSDWIPTLKLLPSLKISQTVVTSYTFHECEEDYDAVEEHCTQTSPHSRIQWNFESELNPYQVLQPMKRLSAPVTS